MTTPNALRAAKDAFGTALEAGGPFGHSMFGTMTVAEAGTAMGKHLDHHLVQIGE